jgi:hypothetical protein
MPPRCERGGRASAKVTVTDALRQHVAAYRSAHAPSLRQDRVLDWLCACQTAALGGRMLECACGWSSPVYNSCRDRHCPQCNGGPRAEWLAARVDQLLPVPHFQVVFTFPSELRPLAYDNPKVVYNLLFQAAVETLLTLGKQRFGATIGVLAALHTWASNLTLHPHVHCLVTAGGLRLDGEAWVRSRADFLFPTRVMAPIFRGKFVEGLRAAFDEGKLHVRGNPAHARVAFDALIRSAHRNRWVVHVEPPNGRPVDHVAKYLARYVHGVAISDARMVAVTEEQVTFRARDQLVTLSGAEFVRRFAQHILPRRFNKVRYTGLYAAANVHTKWTRARQLLQAGVPPERPQPPARTCPLCGRQVRERSIPGLPMAPPRIPPRARGPP